MVVDAAGLAVLLWQGWLYFDSVAHLCALICAVIIGLVRTSAYAAVHRSCPSQLHQRPAPRRRARLGPRSAPPRPRSVFADVQMRVGQVEVPFLCACHRSCDIAAAKLKPLEDNLMLRGVIYLLLGLVSIILPMLCTDAGTSPWGCDNDGDWGLTVAFLALVADGVFYIIGHIRGESGGGAAAAAAPAAKPEAPVVP